MSNGDHDKRKKPKGPREPATGRYAEKPARKGPARKAAKKTAKKR